MVRYSGNTKNCATCANWGGERKIEMGFVVVASVSERGKCYGGSFTTVSPGPCCSASCNKFTKWCALK